MDFHVIPKEKRECREGRAKSEGLKLRLITILGMDKYPVVESFFFF